MKHRCVALILALLLFTSCTPVDNTPISSTQDEPNEDETAGDATDGSGRSNTLNPDEWNGEIPSERNLISPSASSMLWRGHGIIVREDGTILDTATGQTTSLCFDPICEGEEHTKNTCPQKAFRNAGRYFIISPLESREGLVIYAGNYGSIIRYDQMTQSITVVGNNLSSTGATWRFDPYTLTIYYTAYRTESPTGMSFCALDTKTGEVKVLADVEAQSFASYISDQTLYIDADPAEIYTIDLTAEEPGAQELISWRNKNVTPYKIIDGYFYFCKRERQYYTVPQEVLDRHNATFDANAREYWTYDDTVYRVSLQDLNGEPEVVAQGISFFMFIEGYMFYIKRELQPAFSYVTYQGKNYAWDDPAAPPEGMLKHVFPIDTDEGGIIDLATMEDVVTFRLDGYCMTPYVVWDFDGTEGFMYGEVLDYREELFIDKEYSSALTVYVNIPLRQGVVTDEDMIIMEPN
ncbi:MAG: hypothetical protein IJW40_04935 [Clostridia bacterium]|nr:hypothetical protein [Clostridia bacterium]